MPIHFTQKRNHRPGLANRGHRNYITPVMKRVLFFGDINVDVMMGGLVSQPIIDKEITCSSFDITVGSSAAICACALYGPGRRRVVLRVRPGRMITR